MVFFHYLTRIHLVVWRWRISVFLALVFSLIVLSYVHHTARSQLAGDKAFPERHSLATPATSTGRNSAVSAEFHDLKDRSMFQRVKEMHNHSADSGERTLVTDVPNVLHMQRSQVYVPPLRVIHLDLKGAPPSVEYIEHVMRISRRLGATGMLIEWEDMLPFSGVLESASATNHYSVGDVERLLAEAARLQLEVIPLVQTFGHMEHVLKLRQFSNLREDPLQPAAICPSRNESRQLLRLLVDQVLLLHPSSRRIHIGCDEVFQLGTCRLCRQRPSDHLFLDHVRFVGEHVRRHHKDVTPLIWDDMMRHMSVADLQRSGIGQLVEPVVWVYAEDVERFVGHYVFDTLAQVFPTVWAASAFKGAFGETLVLPPIGRHIENTVNWLRVMQREAESFTARDFRGLILTGWQRYDHFAVLCELLPVSMPSLSLNLAVASHGFFNSSLRTVVFDALQCDVADDQIFLELSTDPVGFFPFSYCGFPGVEVFKMAVRISSLVERVDEFVREIADTRGWLTEYNEAHNFSSPFRVDELLQSSASFRMSLRSMASSARSTLLRWFDQHTVNEWLEQRLAPVMRRLRRLESRGATLKGRAEWPRRPLVAKSAEKQGSTSEDPVLVSLGVMARTERQHTSSQSRLSNEHSYNDNH